MKNQENNNADTQELTDILMAQLRGLSEMSKPTREQLEASRTMVNIAKQVVEVKKFELDVVKHIHSKPMVVVHEDGTIDCTDPDITIKRLDSAGMNSEIKEIGSSNGK